MRTFKQECDRCHAVSTTDQRFLTAVGFGIVSPYGKTMSPGDAWLRAEWCGDCMDKVRKKAKGEPKLTPQSNGEQLEELLVEMIQDEITNAQP